MIGCDNVAKEKVLSVPWMCSQLVENQVAKQMCAIGGLKAMREKCMRFSGAQQREASSPEGLRKGFHYQEGDI